MSDFLFERDFDLEMEAEGYVPPRKEEVLFTEAQVAQLVAQAKERAFSEGEAAGREAAQAALKDDLLSQQATTLAHLQPEISALSSDLAAHKQRIEYDLSAMCLFLAKNLVPELLETLSEGRIRAFCRKAISMAEGGIELRLSAQMHDCLQSELEAIPIASGACLKIVVDDELANGQARAAWAGGGATYDYQQMLNAMLATFTTILRDAAPSESGS